MQTMVTVERETVDQAVIRLAAEAARRGVRVYRVGEAWFSPSRTRPGTSHRVTGFSCSCPGFFRHGRCTHNAALLVRMGWLPIGDPDPGPPATPAALPVPSAPCPDCHGEGYRRMSTGGGLDDWLMVDCRCQRAAA